MSDGERHCVPSAAIVLLMRDTGNGREMLLQRRRNTGFADGMWDLSASGHAEKGESIADCAVRECLEETGVRVEKENLNFFCLIHKKDTDRDMREIYYYNVYFFAEIFDGTPEIMEEMKCSALEWTPADSLPENLMPDRREALRHISSPAFLEWGWQR